MRADSPSFPGAAAVLLALVIMGPGASAAQDRVTRQPGVLRNAPDPLRKTTEIWVVRGQGTHTPQRDRGQADSPPAELTLAEKSALVAGLGQIVMDVGPWSVTPGEPSVPGRAWLSFQNPEYVRTYSVNPQATMTGTSSAVFFDDSSENASVRLHFKPPASGPYLVDCRVTKFSSDNLLHVKVYPGGAEQTFTETGHVFLIYEAPNIIQADFEIWTEGEGMPDWRFLSCEITPLK